MQNLIFLGQIPFTDIYINFWEWLGFVIIMAPLAVWLYHQRRRVIASLLAAYAAWLIRRHKQSLVKTN